MKSKSEDLRGDLRRERFGCNKFTGLASAVESILALPFSMKEKTKSMEI